jgi:hypothetical protein
MIKTRKQQTIMLYKNGYKRSALKKVNRGRIFSHVRPFYEWAVSDLDP